MKQTPCKTAWRHDCAQTIAVAARHSLFSEGGYKPFLMVGIRAFLPLLQVGFTVAGLHRNCTGFPHYLSRPRQHDSTRLLFNCAYQPITI